MRFCLVLFLVCLSTGSWAAEEKPKATATATAAPTGPMPERLSLGFNLGASIPSTIGGYNYSVFPTLGLNFEYRIIPLLSVGASTQESIFVSSANSAATLIEGATLAQVQFHLFDTGFYAGIRAGLNVIFFQLGLINGQTAGFVWGPKVGYQYHFSNSRFAIGPEANMLFISSSTQTDNTSAVTIASHQSINLVVVLKWWL